MKIKKFFAAFIISAVSTLTMVVMPYSASAMGYWLDMERGVISQEDPNSYYFYGKMPDGLMSYEHIAEKIKDTGPLKNITIHQFEEEISFPGSKIEMQMDGHFTMICPTDIFNPNNEYYNSQFSKIFSEEGLNIYLNYTNIHSIECNLTADAIDYGTATDEVTETDSGEVSDETYEDTEDIESANTEDITDNYKGYTSSPQTGDRVSSLLAIFVISGAVAYTLKKK